MTDDTSDIAASYDRAVEEDARLERHRREYDDIGRKGAGKGIA